MTLRQFQTGLVPIGFFDFKDDQISSIKGGEVVVFDSIDLTITDTYTADVYNDNTRTQVRLATEADTGPFFLVDADRNTGSLSEVALESTSMFSSAAPYVQVVNTSGKYAIFAMEGFYSITSNVFDTTTITSATLPNTRLYVDADGLLTATKSASTAIAGFFIEYRQKSVVNARLLNLTGTDRNFDTVIFYKTNADGYNTPETISAIISQAGVLGAPTDGTYSDGYFSSFSTTTRIADAVDDLNELLDIFNGTGNDGYAFIEIDNFVSLQPILERYVVPSFEIIDFSADVSTVEVGQVLATPSFSGSYNRGPASVVLSDTDGYSLDDVSATPDNFTSSHSYSKNTNGATVGFTLTAIENGDTDDDTAVITWLPRIFYGVGVDGGNSEVFIEALGTSALASSRIITFNLTAGVAQHIYYGYPASYGAATISVGGIAGGFALVSAGISVTNSFGKTQDYRLYKSDNSNLGNLTVVVT